MGFPDSDRVIYQRNPLVEVIAALSFSPVLRIEADAPAEFQELIRAEYPGYREDRGAELPPEIPQQLRDLARAAMSSLLPQERRYHRFLSEDEQWMVTLARDVISLHALHYERWEDFQRRFEAVLTALVASYAPPFFTRVGLRYRDLIVRSQLELEAVPWRDLLQPHIAGELADEAIDEASVLEVRRVAQLVPYEGASLTLQHGIVTVMEPVAERAYLIDADFFKEGHIDAGEARAVLERANREAGRLFRWCITPRLHDRLGPGPLPAGG